MKKWYVRMFVFFTILVILIEIASVIFIPNKSNLLQFGLFNKTKYDILDEPNDSIDVVFLGDSLVYNGISPMYIWHEYGYTTFDAAIPAMTIEEAYNYSKIVIESQHPKLVMFEADVLYRDLHHIERYKYKILDLKKFVPLLTFHNNWKQLGEKDWVNPYKGFKFSSKVNGPKKPRDLHKSDMVRPIDDLNMEYFEKMMKLYRDNNIDIMFVENPTINWQYDHHNRIAQLAEEYDLELLNLNLIDLKIDWEKETKDEGVHMNYLGARKVSKYLAEYIKEKNIATDHRDDPEYSLWDKAYKIYETKLFD